MDFKKKSILELRKYSIEKISEYYMELRKYNYENNVPINGIEIRKKIHSLLLLIVKLDRILSHEKLYVINDERNNTQSPVIFACTHIGGNDVQRTFEAIKEHSYLFLGDPKGLYKDAAGLLLYLNGMISLETNNKLDRKISKERAVELLSKNGNLLIYPEGAWNITPNLPVMKLYKGTAQIALETNAEIVPIAIAQYDDEFYVSIGSNIVTKDCQLDDIQLTELLRDRMAEQKWKIYESLPMESRKNMNIDINSYQEQIVKRCGYDFTVQDVLDTMYHDKNIITEEEVFDFCKK